MPQTDTTPGELSCPMSPSLSPGDSGKAAAWAAQKGILLCLAATFMYSFSNVCLRQLGDIDTDQRWTIFIKECVSIGCLTPLILYWSIRRQYHWPALRWVVYILFGGFCCQYIGSRLHLHAFAVIGLLVSVPLIQAATMVFSAAVGRGFLGERISGRCLSAMIIMLSAMGFLIFGPSKPVTEQSAQLQTTNTLVIAGLGTVLAGLAYSVHVVCIRVARQKREMPVTLIALLVTGIGAVIFGFEFLRDNGWRISAFWEGVPTGTWQLIIASGFLNLIGFLLQITGLRYTMVARSQMIAVAQIVIGTLFGVFFFKELTNGMIWIGVALTVVGIFIVSTPDKK